MSYLSEVLASIPSVQANLNSVWSGVADSATIQKVPFLDVVANQFSNPLQQVITPGQGKVVQMSVVYDQEIPLSDVQEDVDNPVCTQTEVYENCTEVYEMDTEQNFSSGEKIVVKSLRTADVENGAHFQRRLFQHMMAVERKLNVHHSEELTALAGKYAGDVTTTNDAFVMRTIKSGSTDIEQLSLNDLSMALEQSNFNANPIVLGGADFVKYSRAISGAGVANSGIDVGRIAAEFGLATMYDRVLAAALVANNNGATNVAIAPGALTLLQYSAASWKDGVDSTIVDGGNYVHFTMQSPRTGIPMDITIKDDCGTIHMAVTATTKLVGLPNDLYDPNGNFDGVNGINLIKVDNS